MGAAHSRGILAATRWLPSYKAGWLRGDIAAGVTLAAYMLPAALGNAFLAGFARSVKRTRP